MNFCHWYKCFNLSFIFDIFTILRCLRSVHSGCFFYRLCSRYFLFVVNKFIHSGYTHWFFFCLNLNISIFPSGVYSSFLALPFCSVLSRIQIDAICWCSTVVGSDIISTIGHKIRRWLVWQFDWLVLLLPFENVELISSYTSKARHWTLISIQQHKVSPHEKQDRCCMKRLTCEVILALQSNHN